MKESYIIRAGGKFYLIRVDPSGDFVFREDDMSNAMCFTREKAEWIISKMNRDEVEMFKVTSGKNGLEAKKV